MDKKGLEAYQSHGFSGSKTHQKASLVCLRKTDPGFQPPLLEWLDPLAALAEVWQEAGG